MGETLEHNELLETHCGDYKELNDLSIPLELNDRFMKDSEPEIEEIEIMDIPRVNVVNTRNYDEFEGYPSFCDYVRKIRLRLQFTISLHDRLQTS